MQKVTTLKCQNNNYIEEKTEMPLLLLSPCVRVLLLNYIFSYSKLNPFSAEFLKMDYFITSDLMIETSCIIQDQEISIRI